MSLSSAALKLLKLFSFTGMVLVLFEHCSSQHIDLAPTEPDKRPCFFHTKQRIVILGSSTAEGWGATTYDSSWAGRLTKYASNSEVINLAKAGYITAQILPAESRVPAIDIVRNIDAALKLQPTCIIISMTTNDIAKGLRADSVMANIHAVVNYAQQRGVKYVVVTTPHPRNISPGATAQYLRYRDRVLTDYQKFAVNFFDRLVGKENLPDPALLADGIHPNNTGHKILFDQVIRMFTAIGGC